MNPLRFALDFINGNPQVMNSMAIALVFFAGAFFGWSLQGIQFRYIYTDNFAKRWGEGRNIPLGIFWILSLFAAAGLLVAGLVFIPATINAIAAWLQEHVAVQSAVIVLAVLGLFYLVNSLRIWNSNHPRKAVVVTVTPVSDSHDSSTHHS